MTKSLLPAMIVVRQTKIFAKRADAREWLKRFDVEWKTSIRRTKAGQYNAIAKR